MAVTYFWTINPLNAYPTASGETDVVFTAHWQLHAQEIANEVTWSASSIGTAPIPLHSGSAFTPFEQLTLDQVTGWVTESLGTGSVEAMKEGLAQQIAYQINPPILVLQSPWLPTGSV